MISKLRKSFRLWPRKRGQKKYGLVIGLHTEQKEAWRKQIFEVQTWKQVRGPAGAVWYETRDLGVKWPQWHTLLFEDQGRVDMRVVCPRDVRKMLQKHVRTTYWRKWATKHEYEELMEGIWFDPEKLCCGRN